MPGREWRGDLVVEHNGDTLRARRLRGRAERDVGPGALGPVAANVRRLGEASNGILGERGTLCMSNGEALGIIIGNMLLLCPRHGIVVLEHALGFPRRERRPDGARGRGTVGKRLELAALAEKGGRGPDVPLESRARRKVARPVGGRVIGVGEKVVRLVGVGQVGGVDVVDVGLRSRVKDVDAILFRPVLNVPHELVHGLEPHPGLLVSEIGSGKDHDVVGRVPVSPGEDLLDVGICLCLDIDVFQARVILDGVVPAPDVKAKPIGRVVPVGRLEGKEICRLPEGGRCFPDKLHGLCLFPVEHVVVVDPAHDADVCTPLCRRHGDRPRVAKRVELPEDAAGLCGGLGPKLVLDKLEPEGHGVDPIGKRRVGLVRHRPTSLHKHQLLPVHQRAYPRLHARILLPPPPLEKRLLHIVEHPLRVLFQRRNHRVQNPLHPCQRDRRVGPRIVLVHRLQPSHIIMSVCNHFANNVASEQRSEAEL